MAVVSTQASVLAPPIGPTTNADGSTAMPMVRAWGALDETCVVKWLVELRPELTEAAAAALIKRHLPELMT